jgi:hypothetical protein
MNELYRGAEMALLKSDGVLVVVHLRPGTPSDEGWNAFATALRKSTVGEHRVLVLAIDATLNPRQREDVRKILGRATQVAVITDSPATRGIITALSWFGMPIRAFAPASWDRGLSFLGFEQPERIRAAVASLGVRLAQPASESQSEQRRREL